MSAHPLTPLFAPRSIAVIGASEVAGSVGAVLMENLRGGRYTGKLYAVNPRHASLFGAPAWPSIDAVPEAVDLAVIGTRAETLPGILERCAARRVPAAAIISAGLTDATRDGARLLQQVGRIAREHGIRLLGPNSMGVIRPALGMNATFTLATVNPGSVALVSQSGGLASAILDWAVADGVGFSSVLSLGNQLDVDFAEALDYLTVDGETESIVLYLEGIRTARRFMSSLRAAARVKPVIVLKTGRGASGARAAATHTGAMTGADDVFDAALRRAGAVRVETFTQLLSAAKCLSSRYRATGRNLAIVTNGGGPGVMAADRAAEAGLVVGTLSPDTIATLDKVLPAAWSRGNPVDLLEDADTARYRHAVEACLADPKVDGVVTILTPQGMTDPAGVASAVVDISHRQSKQLIACWMGDERVRKAREILQAAQLPVFRTPEPAVEAFANIASFYQNQRLLMQVPGPLSQPLRPDVDAARSVIEAALGERRRVLSEMESKTLLAAFHIPVATTIVATTAQQAIMIAQQLGFPVAMKVQSPDVSHKSDSGGVRLNITSTEGVRAAFADITDQVKAARPDARVDGIAIERMVVKRYGRELLVGVVKDPVFGPVITCGSGGTAVELIADRATALPPLNGFLARNLIERTRAAATLGSWRGGPPADMAALEDVLLRVSEMVCELPWLTEMDVNPVILDDAGAVAVDARIVVDPLPPSAALDRYGHMAICPYPSHLTQSWVARDGREIVIRAIRPEDAEMEQEFVRNLSDESRYFRFINAIHELSDRMLVRFTQIDYDRELALVAVANEAGRDVQWGVARYAIAADGLSCEFAIVVADAAQGMGLGTRLMASLLDAARARGLQTMEGFVLSTNHKMLKLMESLGFDATTTADDPTLKRVVKRLV